MKVLAFQAGEMHHHNGTVWAGTPFCQTCDNEGYRFEGRRITSMGIIGPEYIKTALKERLERHRTLDSALLQRIATYEVDETNWVALIAVEGLCGVYYLRRMPGMTSSLIYYPLPDNQAIIITHRSTKPKFIEADKAAHVRQAIYHYRTTHR